MMKNPSTLQGKIESPQFCQNFLSYLSSETGSVLLVELDDETARSLVTLLINIIQAYSEDEDSQPVKKHKASLISIEKKARQDDTENNMIHGAALNALFRLLAENSLIAKHVNITSKLVA